MLILISKIEANKEEDNLYTGITLSDEALHASKGVLDYHINKLITKQMLLDMLKFQKRTFLSQYSKVEHIKQWYPPSNFWCENLESTKIHIGVDGTDCDILTLNGDGEPLSDTSPLCQILVCYTEREGKVLSYLISEYKPDTREYTIQRIQEVDLIEKIDAGAIFSNAITEFTEEGEELVKPVGFGFTTEIDIKNAARLQKIKSGKRTASKLTKDATGFSKDTVLKEQFDSANENILEFLSADDAGACTKEQKEFLAKYYSWYLKKAFELIIGNSRVNISINKKAALDTLKISKDSKWEFKGCAYSKSQSIHCSDPSCNKGLKKAYVFTANTEDGIPMELYFGINCAQAFFDINSNDLETMQESVSKAEIEIKELFAAAIDTGNYDGRTKIEDLIFRQQLFRDSISDLDQAGALEKIYGEASEWLRGFIANGLPIPDTLNTMIITTFVRKTKVVEENSNNPKAKSEKKEEEQDPNLRKHVLNATLPDDVEFKESQFQFYWMSRTPEYSDLVKYFENSKKYFDFMYKYKLFSMPLTGSAAINFDKKHSNELRHLAWEMNAMSFTAEELADIVLLLKIEKLLSEAFEAACLKEGIDLDERDLDKHNVLRRFILDFQYKFRVKSAFSYRSVSSGVNKKFANPTVLTAILRKHLPDVQIPREITSTGRRTTILVKAPKYRLICPDYSDFNDNFYEHITYTADMSASEKKSHYVSKLDALAENPKALKETLTDIQVNYQKYVDYINSDGMSVLKNSIADSRRIKQQREEQKRIAEERDRKNREILEAQAGLSPINFTQEDLLAYDLYKKVHKQGTGLILDYEAQRQNLVLRIQGKTVCKVTFLKQPLDYRKYDSSAYTGNVEIQVEDERGYNKYLYPDMKESNRYKVPVCTLEVLDNSILIKEQNGLFALCLNFEPDGKKVEVKVKYTKDSNTIENTRTYDLRTAEEKEEERKQELLRQLEALKSQTQEAFMTEDYPEKIADTIEVKDTDNLGKMLLFIHEEIKSGRFNSEDTFAPKVLDTLCSALKKYKKTRCSAKQYLYVNRLIKQIQKKSTEKIEKIEAEATIDLMEVYAKLVKTYGTQCISGSMASQLSLVKDKKYESLNFRQKEMLCDAICRFISRYQLDKSDKQYGYDLIPEHYRKDIKFLVNDKDLEDKLLEISANLKNIKSTEKSASILQTVLRNRWFSDKQWPYLKELINSYDVYITTKNIDDVDADADF